MAREYAALLWAEVIEEAAHLYAHHDKAERAKRLERLERSGRPSDRHAAALVRRWDAAKD